VAQNSQTTRRYPVWNNRFITRIHQLLLSGMAFITSNKYADWKGNLLVGSLKFKYVNKCVIENGKVVKEERLLGDLGRVCSINQSPDGYRYVGIENLGLSDNEVADVMNYISNSWGNKNNTLTTTEEVSKIKQ